MRKVVYRFVLLASMLGAMGSPDALVEAASDSSGLLIPQPPKEAGSQLGRSLSLLSGVPEPLQGLNPQETKAVRDLIAVVLGVAVQPPLEVRFSAANIQFPANTCNWTGFAIWSRYTGSDATIQVVMFQSELFVFISSPKLGTAAPREDGQLPRTASPWFKPSVCSPARLKRVAAQSKDIPAEFYAGTIADTASPLVAKSGVVKLFAAGECVILSLELDPLPVRRAISGFRAEARPSQHMVWELQPYVKPVLEGTREPKAWLQFAESLERDLASMRSSATTVSQQQRVNNQAPGSVCDTNEMVARYRALMPVFENADTMAATRIIRVALAAVTLKAAGEAQRSELMRDAVTGAAFVAKGQGRSMELLSEVFNHSEAWRAGSQALASGLRRYDRNLQVGTVGSKIGNATSARKLPVDELRVWARLAGQYVRMDDDRSVAYDRPESLDVNRVVARCQILRETAAVVASFASSDLCRVTPSATGTGIGEALVAADTIESDAALTGWIDEGMTISSPWLDPVPETRNALLAAKQTDPKNSVLLRTLDMLRSAKRSTFGVGLGDRAETQFRSLHVDPVLWRDALVMVQLVEVASRTDDAALRDACWQSVRSFFRQAIAERSQLRATIAALRGSLEAADMARVYASMGSWQDCAMLAELSEGGDSSLRQRMGEVAATSRLGALHAAHGWDDQPVISDPRDELADARWLRACWRAKRD